MAGIGSALRRSEIGRLPRVSSRTSRRCSAIILSGTTSCHTVLSSPSGPGRFFSSCSLVPCRVRLIHGQSAHGSGRALRGRWRPGRTAQQGVLMNDMTEPDLRGRLAVVTGGSDGVGLGLATRLAHAGAELILPVRNMAKGTTALELIRTSVPCARISLRLLDLASLASVENLADTLNAESRPINLLVNNAGVMSPPLRHTTKDGYELQFGTNYLGHVALTGRLMPSLRAGHARVTTVTSSAARGSRINWDDPQGVKRYSPVRAYGQSKLANLLFALELERRSAAGG